MGIHLQVYDNNFEQCMKCSICTAYCPVTLVNQDFPGPKQSGPDGERYRLKDKKFFDRTLEYCLNCKRCEVACPSDVKIADIIQVEKLRNSGNIPLRNRIMAETDVTGSFASMFYPIANPLFKSRMMRRLFDMTLKIDNRRTYPHYTSMRFRTWYYRHAYSSQMSYRKHVVYFHGCYVNYNNPKLGKDLIKILNAVGIGVLLIDEKCCGMPLIMNGLAKKATLNGVHNIREMSIAIKKSMPILTTSSTCTLTMRDEYDRILGLNNQDVRMSIFLASRYLYDLIDNGQIVLKFKKDKKQNIVYHASCHIEKLGWAIYSSKLISMIPGSKTTVIDSLCCGLSGTYGYKKENYENSQKIGRSLFEKIASFSPDVVCSDCESCKWQIEMSTTYNVKNPIEIIADALDIEATRKANGL